MFYGKFQCPPDSFKLLLKKTESYKEYLCFLESDEKNEYYYLIQDSNEERIIRDILSSIINLEPSSEKEVEDICSGFPSKFFKFNIIGNRSLIPF
jgi:hypothetical protein